MTMPTTNESLGEVHDEEDAPTYAAWLRSGVI
jgi:hypothetical protein